MSKLKRSTAAPTELNGTFSIIKSKVIELETQAGFSVQADYVNVAPAAKTFVSGVIEVDTITLPAFAGFTDRDYVVAYDTDGVSYAVYGDKTGTSIAPTGAAYLAATYKVKANISADTTATQVCDRFRTAFNTLTGLTAAVTTSGTTTLIMTQVSKGAVTNPVPKNLDDSGAGAITVAETTAGVTTKIALATNYITITAHPYVTGTKAALTTDTTLPTGLSATNYWISVIDANTIGLSTSLALATAGTLVDITADGVGTHTLTATTAAGNVFKMLKSNDAVTYTDISSMTVTADTATLSTWFEVAAPTYKYIKLLYTPAACQATLTTTVCQLI